MGEQTKTLHGVGKQGVQPRREVPSAVSGSQLGAKQMFSCLTYCKSCRLRNTMAAWVASTISSYPPAHQPRCGTPPCPRSSRGLLGGWPDLGSTVLPGDPRPLVRSTSEAAPASVLPWPAGTRGRFPLRTRIPAMSSPRGCLPKAACKERSLLTHCSLLLPLVGVIQPTGAGFPTPSVGRGVGGQVVSARLPGRAQACPASRRFPGMFCCMETNL